NAKDDLHAQALKLREEGWSVNDIALELGVARSTAWQWVRHLPLDRDSERAKLKRAHAKLMSDDRWEKHRYERDERRAGMRAVGADDVGALTSREVLLLGAVAYWCEGAKEKPWKIFGQLVFSNSDPRLIRLYLAFLNTIGVAPARIEFRLYIHESADADEA